MNTEIYFEPLVMIKIDRGFEKCHNDAYYFLKVFMKKNRFQLPYITFKNGINSNHSICS